MKRVGWAAALMVVALTGACATTEFTESSSQKVYRGNGGEPQKVDGMDVWIDNAPARPYRIIGFVDDDRSAGFVTMSRRLPAIAALARRAGGDGVVINGPHSQQTAASVSGYGATSVFDSSFGDGGWGASHSNTATTGSPLPRTSTRAAVIQFVR